MKRFQGYFQTWTVLLVAVCICYAFSFIELRQKHESQVTATKQGIFVFSSLDTASAQLTKRLQGIPSILTLELEDPSTITRIKKYGLKSAPTTSVLLLPNHGMYAVAQGKTIEQVLAPLFGGHTPYFRGSITALAAIAIWVLFSIWAARVAYFGALWPALGLIALSLSIPSCRECRSAELLGWLPWVGLIGFSICLFPYIGAQPKSRLFLWLSLFGSASAAFIQAYAVLVDPKLCPYCIVAAAAAAGSFLSARALLSAESPRCITLSRLAASGVCTCALLAATFHLLTPIAKAETLKNYTSVIGKNLASYVAAPPKLKSRQLILVSLNACGACENAKTDLLRGGISFLEISYETLLRSPSQFRADFNRVAPLLLICDSKGTILRAEAGWTSVPEEKEELLRGYRKSLGGDDVSKI